MTSLLRRLALLNQGLGKPDTFGGGLAGTRKAIEHLGYVQIDTISVVERAHHHVLWNRVPDYDLEHLNYLVREKHIFEHWAHAASYLPMRDYRYAIPFMTAVRNGENRYFSRGDAHLMNEILARVKAEGKIKLRDVGSGNKKNTAGWWNAGPSRRAIEQLFMQGDLMVCERNGMEKVYDLAERCLPSNIDLTPPSTREFAQYLFDTTLRTHGVFTWKQLVHLRAGKELREVMRRILNDQIDLNVVQSLKMPDGQTVYATTDVLEQASCVEPIVRILSPFDNLVIHRDRLSCLFSFEYRIECYVSATKRVYGYFCLPLLYMDHFVGRIDCKVHRAEQRLEILSLHLENEAMQNNDAFIEALNTAIQEFTVFNKCSIIETKKRDLQFLSMLN
ncbi:winged helix-turn-helix domain-containing protein [Acinetobacter sp.]|uniref:winged helix-turn-helix domain-containing protein n=1 Tax=Acinetobacter sp. TaxID=472 RepID=UPI002FDADF3D